MDPFVTLADHYVDSRPGLGHSALPHAPRLPVDQRQYRTSRLLSSWRRLLARRSERSRRGPAHARPSPGLPVRSAHMAQGE